MPYKHKQLVFSPSGKIDLAVEVPKLIPNWDTLADALKKRESVKVITGQFYLYCEKNLKIVTKKGELEKFVPNWAQKDLVERVLKDLHNGRPVRYIVLKARQLGLSTIIEALAYWWAATHMYVSAAIAAHEADSNQALYKMFQRYYENTDPVFKPKSKYYTQNDLTFDTEKGQGLHSSIKTFVAKEGGVGRGSTNTFLHCSEVAFWKNGTEVVAGLLQTVPALRDTFIFLESTANGIGGYFYEEWQHAKKGDSVFTPLFYPWHQHPEYEMNVPPKINLTEPEKELIQMFKKVGYPQRTHIRKIMWRRWKMKEFRADPDKFMQEYPSTDQEAFVATGRPVFDIKRLLKMETLAEHKQFNYYVLDGNRSDVTAELISEGPLKVWETPEDGAKYVIGVDVAEGLEHGDYSVIDITRVDTLKTVARWRGHTDPDLLGDEAVLLGWWYNNALLGVEVNNHGLTTIQRIRDRFYRNLYMRESKMDELFEMATAKMGWRTDRKTKPLMIDDLATAIRENDIIDYDITFIRECMTYVRDDRGMTNAVEGMHDDTVMAKAIALQLFEWQDWDRSALKIGKPNVQKLKARPYKRLKKIKNESTKKYPVHFRTKFPNLGPELQFK